MSKVSMRKFSVLGLVLLAASAVTAAIIPSKSKSSSTVANNGRLVPSTLAAVNTCTTEAGFFQCTATVGALTVTTAGAGNSANIATATATPTSDDGLNTSAGG